MSKFPSLVVHVLWRELEYYLGCVFSVIGQICLAMWLGVCDRPFTTVNFGAAQVSCAQLMNQFVPGDLVVSRSVVMAKLSILKMYMPMHNDRKWWSCDEVLGNNSYISITDRGESQSQ